MDPSHHPMLRSLSYNFPPPHQLGTSSSIRLSRSTQSALALATPPSGTGNTLKHLSASLGLKSTSEPQVLGEGEGIDEPDIGRKLGRKAPSPARAKGAPRTKHARVEPIVKRHNGGPLSEFALFLPPKIPQAILQSRSTLLEFVKSTSMTYLNLWEFAGELTVLDLRFPTPYSDRLCEDYQFLTELFSAIIEKLGNVKSIRELYLPQIVLHSHTKLEDILRPFSKTTLTIPHVFLPIKTSLQEDDIASFDHKNIATFLQKSKIQELTLISVATVVQDFKNELQAEIKKSRRMGTTKVNYSGLEMGPPGPAYIVDLGVKPAVGEAVDPHKLVRSLNVIPETRGSESAEGGRQHTRRRVHKEKAKGAFSTDCTYSDEAELDTDGPFASEVWNLGQLHDNGIDGSGITLAVIDSGINYTHAAFKDKIVAVKNFVPEEIDDIDCAIDSDGHGTLCAGIAAGSSFYCPLKSADPNSPCIRIPSGVAPGVKLVICKVVKTSSGEVDTGAFLSALKWIKQLHSSVRRIDVVSISLASTYHSQERAREISELTTMGVIMVCCASNVGRLRFQPISFPGRLGHVLCIGAQDMNGKPTSFSPVGRELDFLAPGDDIWGPGPGTVGPFAMDCASGTSCATPAVAGLVCLVLHAITLICEGNREKFQIAGKPLIDFMRNVWVMREILKEMSSSPGHHSDEIGYGTLNPYRILDRSPEEVMRLINEIIEDE